MQLNEIRLTDELLQALYASSLVVTDHTRVKQPVIQPVPALENKQPATEPIQFLGKNNRHFVILVNYPNQLHLPDDAFEFLSNVLKACQLNAADVAIVNQSTQLAGLPQIEAQLLPTYLVCFGNQALPAGLQPAAEFFPAQQGNLKYLLAPELEVLKPNTDAVKPLKRQLWEALKQMLQIQ